MQIAFVTPLFPPDVSAPASYAKSLLTELVAAHTVIGIIYGHLPEVVTGATLLTVDKRLSPLVRLPKLFALMWQHRAADLYIVTNGPATEFPLLVLAPFLRNRLFFVIADEAAATRSVFTRLRIGYIRLFAKRLITPKVAALLPIEHHPFRPVAAETVTNHQTAWRDHLTQFSL